MMATKDEPNKERDWSEDDGSGLLPTKHNSWTLQRRSSASMCIRDRQTRVADLMLRGVMDGRQIAARLGCSEATVYNDVRAVFDQWVVEDKQKMRQKIAHRVRQLNLAAREALDAFERSKQNTETLTTSYEKVKCSDCNGTGRIGAKQLTCWLCNGLGDRLVERTVRRVTGQVGDPVHLRLYVESVKEMATIQGIYHHLKAKLLKSAPSRPIVRAFAATVDWGKVSDEKILQIKYAYAQALEEAGEDASVVDVNVLPENNG